MERMERDSIVKKVYVGENAASYSVSRSWKRWIDTIKEGLKKRSFYIRKIRIGINGRGL